MDIIFHEFKFLIQGLKDTPWKGVDYIKMLLIKPLIYLYFKINGVKIGKGWKIYGFPKIRRHRRSKIIIGDNLEMRNWIDSNPLGINHPCFLSTWEEGAKITIGNDVGMSGVTICSARNISIGNKVLIGPNTVIIDSDFHPVLPQNRRYNKKDIKISPVIIKDNVFIGMNSIILKGITIGNNSIIAAGSVVTNNVPPNCIFAGNPAKMVGNL